MCGGSVGSEMGGSIVERQSLVQAGEGPALGSKFQHEKFHEIYMKLTLNFMKIRKFLGIYMLFTFHCEIYMKLTTSFETLPSAGCPPGMLCSIGTRHLSP